MLFRSGGIVLGYIWQLIINGILSFFRTTLTADAAYGFWGMVLAMNWQLIGYMMVIYIAAIQNISEEIKEAALIDGVTRGQMVRKIILPLIMPAITICLFMTTTNAFKMFDLNLAPYYVPQQTDIRSESVGRTLGVAEKLDALRAICDGSANPDHYDTLADDWDIESRCRSALDAWGLPHVELTASTDSLSGGEKTRLSLAGLTIHRPAIVLLDEPTNHLDRTGRDRLYDYIRTCKATLIVVSHDTYLLNLLDRTCELSKKGLKTYGGNYNFYREQKRIEDSALEQRIDSEQAALRLARKKAQEIAERQQKRFNQGERNKDRLPRILRKGAKDRGETTISKLREKHSDIVGLNEKRLNDLRRQRGTACRFKIDFDDALLHNGKLLIAADGVNFGYDRERPLWRMPLDLEIRSGERIRLTGNNGSGKTTLVRLLTGELFPTAGEIRRTDFSYVCLDQEYSLVDTPQTVLELAQKYNRSNLCDHEIKMRLKRALFAADTWDTSCNALSGGEKSGRASCRERV